ncbi:hypothetical protein D9619_003460 [Psilocybe cf. subviscida]|uniref:Uncharacterized protein n=1 Tax=Psilocybe cf. subviscida TaxID=2480587 RepID=A0A8H5AXL4_9AGAR|nr:hypothetical protein D9619_003460 [Psilocybe cf. subviscida]
MYLRYENNTVVRLSLRRCCNAIAERTSVLDCFMAYIGSPPKARRSNRMYLHYLNHLNLSFELSKDLTLKLGSYTAQLAKAATPGVISDAPAAVYIYARYSIDRSRKAPSPEFLRGVTTLCLITIAFFAMGDAALGKLDFARPAQWKTLLHALERTYYACMVMQYTCV